MTEHVYYANEIAKIDLQSASFVGVTFTQDGTTLNITDGGDTWKIKNYFYSDPNHVMQMESNAVTAFTLSGNREKEFTLNWKHSNVMDDVDRIGQMYNVSEDGTTVAGIANWVNSGAGNDNITGRIAHDMLAGNQGNDVIDAHEVVGAAVTGDGVEAYGGAGNDTIVGSLGNDFLVGDDEGIAGGNDVIYGNAGNDKIYGGYSEADATGSGNDILAGGAGNDAIYGGDGADVLYGDNAYTLTAEIVNATVAEAATSEFDGVTYNKGTTYTFELAKIKKDGSDLNGKYAWILRNPNRATLSQAEIDAGYKTISMVLDNGDFVAGNYNDDSRTYEISTVPAGGTAKLTNVKIYKDGVDYTATYAAAVNGQVLNNYSNYNESLLFNTIAGSDAGNDVLVGGAGDDIIYGGAGADSLIGGEGNDKLYGGKDVLELKATLTAGTYDGVEYEAGEYTFVLAKIKRDDVPAINGKYSWILKNPNRNDLSDAEEQAGYKTISMVLDASDFAVGNYTAESESAGHYATATGTGINLNNIKIYKNGVDITKAYHDGIAATEGGVYAYNELIFTGDSFEFAGEFGQDTVLDADSSDVLKFSDTKFEDLTFKRVGNDLVIVKDSEIYAPELRPSVTVKDFFTATSKVDTIKAKNAAGNLENFSIKNEARIDYILQVGANDAAGDYGYRFLVADEVDAEHPAVVNNIKTTDVFADDYTLSRTYTGDDADSRILTLTNANAVVNVTEFGYANVNTGNFFIGSIIPTSTKDLPINVTAHADYAATGYNEVISPAANITVTGMGANDKLLFASETKYTQTAANIFTVATTGDGAKVVTLTGIVGDTAAAATNNLPKVAVGDFTTNTLDVLSSKVLYVEGIATYDATNVTAFSAINFTGANDVVNTFTDSRGDDTFTGGTDNDIFVFNSYNSTDAITDINAGDTIRFNRVADATKLTYTKNVNNDDVEVSTPVDYKLTATFTAGTYDNIDYTAGDYTFELKKVKSESDVNGKYAWICTGKVGDALQQVSRPATPAEVAAGYTTVSMILDPSDFTAYADGAFSTSTGVGGINITNIKVWEGTTDITAEYKDALAGGYTVVNQTMFDAQSVVTVEGYATKAANTSVVVDATTTDSNLKDAVYNVDMEDLNADEQGKYVYNATWLKENINATNAKAETFVFTVGDGADIINNAQLGDTVEIALPNNSDTIIAFSQVNDTDMKIQYGTDSVTIKNQFAQVGGVGAYLQIDDGIQNFVISNSASNVGNAIKFVGETTFEKVEFSKEGTNLLVTYAGKNKITVKDYFDENGAVAANALTKFIVNDNNYNLAWKDANLAIGSAEGMYNIVTGTDGNDAALAGVAGIPNWINGLAGDDTLVGADMKDILSGGDGVDNISAKGANDIIFAGAGNDVVSGGQGDDIIYGENAYKVLATFTEGNYDGIGYSAGTYQFELKQVKSESAVNNTYAWICTGKLNADGSVDTTQVVARKASASEKALGYKTVSMILDSSDFTDGTSSAGTVALSDIRLTKNGEAYLTAAEYKTAFAGTSYAEYNATLVEVSNDTYNFLPGDGADVIKDANLGDTIKIGGPDLGGIEETRAVDVTFTRTGDRELTITYTTGEGENSTEDTIVLENFNFKHAANNINAVSYYNGAGYTNLNLTENLVINYELSNDEVFNADALPYKYNFTVAGGATATINNFDTVNDKVTLAEAELHRTYTTAPIGASAETITKITAQNAILSIVGGEDGAGSITVTGFDYDHYDEGNFLVNGVSTANTPIHVTLTDEAEYAVTGYTEYITPSGDVTVTGDITNDRLVFNAETTYTLDSEGNFTISAPEGSIRLTGYNLNTVPAAYVGNKQDVKTAKTLVVDGYELYDASELTQFAAVSFVDADSTNNIFKSSFGNDIFNGGTGSDTFDFTTVANAANGGYFGNDTVILNEKEVVNMKLNSFEAADAKLVGDDVVITKASNEDSVSFYATADITGTLDGQAIEATPVIGDTYKLDLVTVNSVGTPGSSISAGNVVFGVKMYGLATENPVSLFLDNSDFAAVDPIDFGGLTISNIKVYEKIGTRLIDITDQYKEAIAGKAANDYTYNDVLKATTTVDSTITIKGYGANDAIEGAQVNVEVGQVRTNLADLTYDVALDGEAVNYEGKWLNEKITGTAGNDTIAAKAGDDKLIGNGGNDTFVVADGDGADVIIDANKGDVIRFAGKDSFEGIDFAKSGNDLVISGYGSKNDTLTVQGYFTQDGNDRINTFELSSDNGTFAYQLAWKTSPIDGNEYMFNVVKNDDLVDANTVDAPEEAEQRAGYAHTLKGIRNWVTNYTEEGQLISALNAGDVVLAGDGRDQIFVASSVDGAVYVDGGEGNDLVVGGKGNDILLGGDGADVLYGGKGDDEINGGEGDDLVVGGEGNDTLVGGAGADTFVFGVTSGAGNDVVTDATAEDTIRFVGTNSIEDFNFEKVGTGLVVSYDYDEAEEEYASTVTIADYFDAEGKVNKNVVSKFELLQTAESDPVEYSFEWHNGKIDVVDESDVEKLEPVVTKDGEKGATYNFPKDGVEVDALNIVGTMYGDKINAGKATVSVSVAESAGRNNITTGKYDDKVTLTGYSNNTANLGEGNNEFIVENVGTNKLKAGKGNDFVAISAGYNNVNLGDGNNVVAVGLSYDGDIGFVNDTNPSTAVSTITTGKGADEIGLNGGNNTVKTGKGNDVVVMYSGYNIVSSEAGENIFEILEGTTTDYNKVTGGKNVDHFFVADGVDSKNVLNGESGKDAFVIFDGNNAIKAGKGDDELLLAGGINNVNGGNGNDEFYVAGGINTINGAKGNDTYTLGNSVDDLVVSISDTAGKNVLDLADEDDGVVGYFDVKIKKNSKGKITKTTVGKTITFASHITSQDDVNDAGVTYTGSVKTVKVGGIGTDYNVKAIASDVASWLKNSAAGYTSTADVLASNNADDIYALMAKYTVNTGMM